MVSAIEFSYLNTGFSLNIDESVLSRAVRVKNIVKEKIKRVFESNVVNIENQNVNNINVAEVSTSEDKSLLDLTDDTLNAIAEKIVNMQKQVNVPCVSNRAVLFTGALVSKIRLVTDKWYSSRINVDAANNIITNENDINVTNNLGGEVIPGAWDTAAEKVEQEFVGNIDTNEVELPNLETGVNETELPNLEVENSNETEMNNVSVQPPVVEYNYDQNDDVYSFVPNLDDFTANIVPTVSILEPNLTADENDDVIPEPQDLNVINETKFVPEPVSIPAVETSLVGEENKEEPLIVSKNVETEQAKEENIGNKSKLISIEDKIAMLLQRKNTDFSTGHSISSTVESSFEKVSDGSSEKSELTQTHIMARLRRVLNETSEKDEVIKKLNSKNSSLLDEISQAKDKIRGYEAVVSDLTARNDSLLKENEKLNVRVQEVQTSSQVSISKLENQVEELSKSKSEESESSRAIISELRAKHAEEIAELKEKHAKEMKSVNESKDRQIQAIYATISEVLGDSSIDDNYGRSMAA